MRLRRMVKAWVLDILIWSSGSALMMYDLGSEAAIPLLVDINTLNVHDLWNAVEPHYAFCGIILQSCHYPGGILARRYGSRIRA